MYRCLNPEAVGIELDWERCLPLAERNGFEGIDVPVCADTDTESVAAQLDRHGLRTGGMGLPFDFRAPRSDFETGLAGFPAIVEKASALGQTRFAIWILAHSDDLPMKENIKFHTERLGPVARILADAGCSLGLEFLGPRHCRDGSRFSFVHTMEQMLDLCEMVGPNVGLLLDSWHWYTSMGTVEEILTLDPCKVVYVHVSDAPAGIAAEHQQDSIRCLPGASGVIDLGGFLGALREIGYDGPVAPEPFDPALGQLSPEEAARQTGESLRKVWSLPRRPSLPARMKAVATGGGKAWLVDLPVPRAQGNEVVVKIHASPICGSNMGGFHGDGEWINEGHEGAGEVVAVEESHLLRMGDRVALAPLTACGACADCRRGDVIFCKHRPPPHGSFSQFTRVADVMCTVIPDDISYEHGSLMGCGLGPAYEAIKRIGLQPADTVVITGLGPVGLGAVALASWRGSRVVAVDPEPYRRDLAERLGAALVLDPAPDAIVNALRNATGEEGVKKGIDCSGQESAERMLIDLAGTRATIAFVGENQGTLAVSPSRDMIRKGLTLAGCWHMNVHDAPDLIDFLRRAPEKADLLISHRYEFDDAQEAFDLFASHTTAKVLLLPWG